MDLSYCLLRRLLVLVGMMIRILICGATRLRLFVLLLLLYLLHLVQGCVGDCAVELLVTAGFLAASGGFIYLLGGWGAQWSLVVVWLRA